jgi:hypothetical protein
MACFEGVYFVLLGGEIGNYNRKGQDIILTFSVISYTILIYTISLNKGHSLDKLLLDVRPEIQ